MKETEQRVAAEFQLISTLFPCSFWVATNRRYSLFSMDTQCHNLPANWLILSFYFALETCFGLWYLCCGQSNIWSDHIVLFSVVVVVFLSAPHLLLPLVPHSNWRRSLNYSFSLIINGACCKSINCIHCTQKAKWKIIVFVRCFFRRHRRCCCCCWIKISFHFEKATSRRPADRKDQSWSP